MTGRKGLMIVKKHGDNTLIYFYFKAILWNSVESYCGSYGSIVNRHASHTLCAAAGLSVEPSGLPGKCTDREKIGDK